MFSAVEHETILRCDSCPGQKLKNNKAEKPITVGQRKVERGKRKEKKWKEERGKGREVRGERREEAIHKALKGKALQGISLTGIARLNFVTDRQKDRWTDRR